MEDLLTRIGFLGEKLIGKIEYLGDKVSGVDYSPEDLGFDVTNSNLLEEELQRRESNYSVTLRKYYRGDSDITFKDVFRASLEYNNALGIFGRK